METLSQNSEDITFSDPTIKKNFIARYDYFSNSFFHQGSSSLAVWFISRKSTSAEKLKVALSIRAMKEASL